MTSAYDYIPDKSPKRVTIRRRNILLIIILLVAAGMIAWMRVRKKPKGGSAKAVTACVPLTYLAIDKLYNQENY
jgi:hypothetical protein